MTHEDKYALIAQLRERIAELEMVKDNYKQMVVEQKQRIAELEARVDAYRHANDSKAARIKKMREEYEEDAWSRKQYIAELKEQNLNMMALFRDFYELEFNRDECWEIIKKYGGDA